jgi:hypothetical protein
VTGWDPDLKVGLVCLRICLLTLQRKPFEFGEIHSHRTNEETTGKKRWSQKGTNKDATSGFSNLHNPWSRIALVVPRDRSSRSCRWSCISCFSDSARSRFSLQSIQQKHDLNVGQGLLYSNYPLLISFGYVEPGGTVGTLASSNLAICVSGVHDSKNVLLNIDQQLIVCFNKY